MGAAPPRPTRGESGASQANERRFRRWASGVAEQLDTGFLPLTGGTMTGELDVGGQILSNPLDPTLGVHVGDRDYNDARYHQVTVDHGGIGGLGDDDHTSYLLAAGSRLSSGRGFTFGLNWPIITFVTDVATDPSIEGVGTTGQLRVNVGTYGSLEVDGDILPDVANTHDLGSGALEFKDLYLAGEVYNTPNEEILPGTLTTNTSATMVASGGSLNFGTTGTTELRWMRVGNLVHCWYTFKFDGSGINEGSGNYEVWPPTDGAPALHSGWPTTNDTDRSAVGSWSAADGSTRLAGTVNMEADLSKMLMSRDAGGSFFGSAHWAGTSGDYIYLHIVYPTD